jgi:hypothetical protein
VHQRGLHGSEASEPEIQNELWIADTVKNIKFSNNTHSFGGYFYARRTPSVIAPV